MSPAKLEISDHAQDRLRQRRITRQQVRDALAGGEPIGVDLRGRRMVRKKIRGRYLIVVYLTVIGGFLLITAYWKGEP